MSVTNLATGRFRVYITPFDPGGSYGEEIEVTDYVLFDRLGSVEQGVDPSRFDVGLYNFNSFDITLNNQDGLFSDVDVTESIFSIKRTDSRIRLTFMFDFDLPICGSSIAGQSYLFEEKTIFKGLLEDSASTQNIDDQFITFKILALDSILSRVQVPFSSISNGDLISSVIETCLDQTKITDLLTVSALNINPSEDQAIDDRSELENKTVKSALDQLLSASNSVLFVNNSDEIIVKDRSETSVTPLELFGQASNNGIENIINIKDYARGLNQTFNYITFANTTLLSEDATSVSNFGIKQKEISANVLTNNTKRSNLLDNYRDTYKDPKNEFVVETPISLEFLNTNLFDRFTVDYPTVTFTAFNEQEARYGISSYGVDRYPFSIFNLTIENTVNWKILSRKINFSKVTLEYVLKEV